MSGRHAGRGLSRLRVAWLGAREVFVFAAVGLALPVVLILAVPQLLTDGTAMLDAPTCKPGGTTAGCLAAEPVTLGDALPLELPTSTDVPTGEAHLLRWEGEAVALLLPDGEVVEGLGWGRLHDVDPDALRLLALWPLAALLPFLVVLRKHPRGLVVLAIIALGAAAAGPVAAEGMLRHGFRGLVAGALGTLGVAFLSAGISLWWLRRHVRYQARRVERKAAAAVVPAQRHAPIASPPGSAEGFGDRGPEDALPRGRRV